MRHCWQDREGHQLETRQQMREKDLRDGRKRMAHDAMEGFIRIQAANNLLRGYADRMEKFARFAKAWPMLRCASGMLNKAVSLIADKTNTEQIISLQRTYKKAVINVSCSAVDECVNVHEDDLALLVTCARGGLHDELGNRHDCRDCLCCMSREEWQNCELYHLLDRMPCGVVENMDTSDPSICPYMWGGERVGAEEL